MIQWASKGEARCVVCGRRMELSATGYYDHRCVTKKRDMSRTSVERRAAAEPSFGERLGEGFAAMRADFSGGAL